MNQFKNDLLLRAALGETVSRPPVWVMRQAGRVLPEYRKTREQAGSFKKLVTTPELACEVTIQPVDILGVDAAIIFSDILVIPEALGLPYEMEEGRGPYFNRVIETENDLSKLSSSDIEDKLSYVSEAIELTTRALAGRVPLIGFAGAPWTVFCYMTEGKGSKEFGRARRMLLENPKLAHSLLSMITEATIAYLKIQVKAGANLVQVFDSWAGVLNKKLYKEFAIPYLKKIATEIQEVPLTVFAKGGWYAMEELAALPCRTLGLDWQMDPNWVRNFTGESKTLQGNLDPAMLYGNFDLIRSETREMIKNFGTQRYIANLGHGVYPDIKPDNLKCFIETIQSS
ncbi:MAG: uroporphyrinogen decarboxylase [Flavobacteriales bacterium]|nr:uroporphyrinogen decarboxylase [Flavobacteriales bacterium]